MVANDWFINGHGNYIVDHGKSLENHGIVFLNFCGNPDKSVLKSLIIMVNTFFLVLFLTIILPIHFQKLEEERDNIQTALSDTESQLQRYQPVYVQ